MAKIHQSNYFDILEAKKAYKEGRNVTEQLKIQKKIQYNTSEIIEISYDLQAGSYVQYALDNPEKINFYSEELSEILNNYINEGDVLLDVGAGELTTLSNVVDGIKKMPSKIFAFDMSWSRIYVGKKYAKKILGEKYGILDCFVADMSEIPILDKTINITTSSHALEPNGGKLKELMSELFRITVDKLILFEPSYEINTELGKKRMDELGYIKNIEGVIQELGGELVDKVIIRNIANKLNPTVCYVIKPPVLLRPKINKCRPPEKYFSVPGTDVPLDIIDNFYYSNEVGLCYPILKSIPILKSNAAVLATSLDD